jgi:thymidylate kinase
MVKSSVELVKPKNLLKNLKRTGDIIQVVLETLKDLPEIEKQKYNPDLILYICRIVENSYNKKSLSDEKINKKDMVFNILKKLYPNLSDADKVIIDGIIEHLHSSGRIKKINIIKLIYSTLKKFFLK